MDSREKILSAVRQNQPPPAALPSLGNFKGSYTDPAEKYRAVFTDIGGHVVMVRDLEEVTRVISERFGAGKRVVTTLPELADTMELYSSTADPHSFNDVELAVIRGHFGVAENGAVWLTEDLMGHRIIPYICQHLAVVIMAESIVPTLHEAYQLIGEGTYGFGAFISGPSKTADIEQALVLGAHGPLSMTVFVIGANNGAAGASQTTTITIRGNLREDYQDVYTREALDAFSVMERFNSIIKDAMAARIARRTRRQANMERITFLDPGSKIPGTEIFVKDARDGKFDGAPIPPDLQRQWIQGTGPGAKPNAAVDNSIRNVAYALLSGADGWMFDGEDALGQITTMSLDNQRNLKLAIGKDRVFTRVAEQVAAEMNKWSTGFLTRPIIHDWKEQLNFTTKIFRARGLHLDDRHIRDSRGVAMAASIADLVLYVVNNHKPLQAQGASIVLYLPKIQTAGEAAVWCEMMDALEDQLGLGRGTIKVYVLVEQLEATFQLMEIRAALGKHFVGFNTGRWDYINSVCDAMSWDKDFVNPNIESIIMTYGYMRSYEDRVRRAVNTPDRNGHYALWQGGMEPNIPVGSAQGVAASMEKALAGARREQRDGASGKWVAHWKMVQIIRPVWEEAGAVNQLGRKFPPLTYTPQDAHSLVHLEAAPRTVRGARNLLSVALQYGNAFGQGMQAAALKPADFFGNDDILYLMEDMATGEIRLSILWEWIHKKAVLTDDDPETGIKAGDVFSSDLFNRLLAEEYGKLQKAASKDVHDASKSTTLPISRLIAEEYVKTEAKLPWFIDLLNINLNNHNLDEATRRIENYVAAFEGEGRRITENLDFVDRP